MPVNAAPAVGEAENEADEQFNAVILPDDDKLSVFSHEKNKSRAEHKLKAVIEVFKFMINNYWF